MRHIVSPLRVPVDEGGAVSVSRCFGVAGLWRAPCKAAPKPVIRVAMWSRYFGGPGGRVTLACLRIAVACSLLGTWWRLVHAMPLSEPASTNPSLYRATGLWQLWAPFVDGPPAPHTVHWLIWGSVAAVTLMLVGFRARVTTALAVLLMTLLGEHAVSYAATWPHTYPVVFLTGLALLGAPVGDALSIDEWLARRRGVALPARAYQWSARTATIVVALMFFSAAMYKLVAGGGTLRWAFSDNLRHHMLAQFDLNGLPRTVVADWLLQDAWRYQAAAFLNLMSQLAPLIAVFIPHRPRLRAAIGGFFVLETIALAWVVDLWNWHWLPLYAVFVDWDAVATWLRTRRGLAVAVALPAVRPSRWAVGWIVALLACDAWVSLGYPRVDARWRTYPFTPYPMFATIRAKPPYETHQSYEFVAARYEVVSAAPVRPVTQNWLQRNYFARSLYRNPRAAELRAGVRSIFEHLQRTEPAAQVTALRLWATTYQVPAYPAPARLVPHDLGILVEVTAHETRAYVDEAAAAQRSAAGCTLFREGLAVADTTAAPTGRKKTTWTRVCPRPSAIGGMAPFVTMR